MPFFKRLVRVVALVAIDLGMRASESEPGGNMPLGRHCALRRRPKRIRRGVTIVTGLPESRSMGSRVAFFAFLPPDLVERKILRHIFRL